MHHASEEDFWDNNPDAWLYKRDPRFYQSEEFLMFYHKVLPCPHVSLVNAYLPAYCYIISSVLYISRGSRRVKPRSREGRPSASAVPFCWLLQIFDTKVHSCITDSPIAHFQTFGLSSYCIDCLHYPSVHCTMSSCLAQQ